jgi:EAL domain-containing protein (putative c-di-GMP-specific phosphodiesterase class I)
VHYQPIVSLSDGGLYGFEALLRWNHPERGLIMPAEFISIAEETGVIIQLGRWILHESCRQMCEWERDFPAVENLILSVNISGKQFAQPDLFHQVEAVLRETAFSPHRLQVEITESAVIENPATVTEVLMKLRELGVALSMDDFGTGYSSLSYLHRFPINTLKIDRSFISALVATSDTGIVRTIIMLAHDLGLKVVAEGVETAEQLNNLQGLSCEFGQGFLFSPPLASNEVSEFLMAKTEAKISHLSPAGVTDLMIEGVTGYR